jgi:hypothetical protein
LDVVAMTANPAESELEAENRRLKEMIKKLQEEHEQEQEDAREGHVGVVLIFCWVVRRRILDSGLLDPSQVRKASIVNGKAVFQVKEEATDVADDSNAQVSGWIDRAHIR